MTPNLRISGDRSIKNKDFTAFLSGIFGEEVRVEAGKLIYEGDNIKGSKVYEKKVGEEEVRKRAGDNEKDIASSWHAGISFSWDGEFTGSIGGRYKNGDDVWSAEVSEAAFKGWKLIGDTVSSWFKGNQGTSKAEMNAHQESKNKEEKESFKDSKEKEKEQEEGSKENSSKQEGDKEESSEKRQKTEDKEGEKTKQEETRKGSGGGNNKERLGSKQEEAKAESAQSEDKGRKIYDEPVGPSMMPKMESEEKIGEEREEKGFFGRETEKYFSRKKLGEIVFGSALILEVPKAAGGWILHMGGAGVKKLSDNFPEGSKVVDTLLEYVNKPVDFLIENMGKGYSWSKGNIIFLSGKVFGSEGGAKVAEGIGGMEREVGDVAAKFKPTEKQGYALKFLEVIGLTKIFASIAKFSANKLVKDAKIDGKADVHADTAGKGQVDDIKIDPYKEAMREGGKHQAWAKQYVDKPDIELERGIKSLEKQIKLHEDKIKNPEKYYPDFKKLDIREQEANINKIWPRDIRKQQEQKRILEDILKNRKKE